MNKKEIQEKLNNPPKPKYLYIRYGGELNKYEVQDNILINVNNTNDKIDTDNQLILGKSSENIIDLIELGDYVNGHKVIKIENNIVTTELLENFCNEDIKSIITHVQIAIIDFYV